MQNGSNIMGRMQRYVSVLSGRISNVFDIIYSAKIAFESIKITPITVKNNYAIPEVAFC